MELAFCYVCQDHIRKNIGEFRRTSSMGHEFYYVGLLNPQETGVVVRTAVISDILHIDRKLYEQLLLNYMGVKTLKVRNDVVIYTTEEECDKAIPWVRHIFLQVVLDRNGYPQYLDEIYKQVKSYVEEGEQEEEQNKPSFWQRVKNKFISKSA
jgi:hypothetical protein